MSDGTSISAVPFQANLGSLVMTANLAYQPQLLLGISVFDNHAFAGAGASFDLPSISAVVSQVDGVNDKCEPLTGSNSNNGDIGKILGNLTHIVASVVVDVVLIAEASASAGDIQNSQSDVHTPWNTSWALPTACLSYDKNHQTYVPASVTTTSTASASTSASASGGKSSRKKSAGYKIGSPMEDFRKRLGHCDGAVWFLAFIFTMFAFL